MAAKCYTNGNLGRREGFQRLVWWKGIDTLLPTLGGSYFFFFCVKVELDERGRTAMMFLIMSAGICQIGLPILADFNGVARHWQ